MYQGIDCCAPLSGAQAEIVRDLGFRFVGRYLVPPESFTKALTLREAHAISAAGLGLFCIWETTANRALDGPAAGTTDGAVALACAHAIGMPSGKPIYFCVDFPAQPADFPAIAAYMAAAKAAIAPGGYRMGAYGHHWIVEYLHGQGCCDDFWQCYAWSGGNHSPHRVLYQALWDSSPQALDVAAKVGVRVDINQCGELSKAGVWRYKEDEQMDIEQMLEAMTEAQAARIVEKAQNHFAKMPLPETWDAAGELAAAVESGITDGTRPMALASRLETAVMVKRAVAGFVPDTNVGDKNVLGKSERVVWEDEE